MKLSKVLASVSAAAIALSALSVSASATMAVPAGTIYPSSTVNSGSYGFQVYNTGNKADGDKAPTNYGIDVEQIGGVSFVIGVDPSMDFDPSIGEAFGGAVAFSCNNSKKSDNEEGTMSAADAAAYNWQTYEWWGWNDGTTDTTDLEKPIQTVANGDGTYTLDAPIGDYVLSNKGCCVQIFLQEWSTEALFAEMSVYSARIYDRAGNTLVEFDELGNPSVQNYWENGYDARLSYSAIAPSEVAATYAAINGEAEVADDAAAATEETVAADTDAAATDATAAAVDTTTASTADKANADTGIEGVAVVAGVAVLAAGAVIVAKKRK